MNKNPRPTRAVEQRHRFHIAQTIYLTRVGFASGGTTSDPDYEVVALMPADVAGQFSYRLRNKNGGERMAMERDMESRA